MSLSIFDTRTIWDDASNAAGWPTPIKYAGTGGPPTPTDFTTDPDPVEGSNCIGIPVGIETVFLYQNGSAVDLTDSLVYAWVLAQGTQDTVENGGLMLMLGDGTNRVGFHLAGSNKAAFRHSVGPVGWQCLMLDTSKLPTAYISEGGALGGSFASLDLANITDIGVGFKNTAKAKGGVANSFVDIIRYGKNGLIVTGGTQADPGTFYSMSLLDRDNANAFGIVRELGAGLYGFQGPIQFGTGSDENTYFADTNVTAVFEDRFVGSDKYKITIVGTGGAAASTSVELGTKVGSGDTATGTAGVSWTTPDMTLSASTADPSASIILSSSTETLNIYGSSFTGFSAGITMSADAQSGSNHEWIGNSVINCGQVIPGYVQLRGNQFNNYAPVSGAALLWQSESINIKNCTFTGNTFAIQHLETGSADYVGLDFSTNTYDLLNESGGPLTASISDGPSPSVYNSGSSTTLVQNQIQVTLTGMVSASEVRVYDVETGIEIDGVEDVGDTGQFSFLDDAGNVVYIVIHAIEYEYILIDNYTIPASNTQLPIEQVFDRNYENPA